MPSRILPPDLPPAAVDQGEFAYETYMTHVYGPHYSNDCPLWTELTANLRNAWTATAQAIIDTRHDVRFVARMA